MRITLIHNPSAGEGNSSADELMEWLADAGFDTRYQSTSEDGWESVLKKPAEFIIAAGGDGTVTKVATALPPDALLAILPLEFIEQSWLYMLYEAGAEFGLADLASEIAVGDKGGFEVVDEEMREAILELRYDPELSARFAALFTWRNFEALSKLLGREPEAKELYLAHVFGASAAAQLIALAAEKPDVKAERHFRRAARANRAIFYHKDRKPRSVAEVIEYLAGKYRRIPVYRKGDDVRHSAPPPVWNPLLPNWHIGGDEIPLAMR
jgi:hypothetical protein